MKKVLSMTIAVIMLLTALCVGASNVSAADQRPSGFIPWFSFENLNIGATPSITGDVADDPRSVSINGSDTITSDYGMEQKIGLLKCEVVSGGPAGKLLSYGAGEKMKTDNAKYASGIWWPIKISEVGDSTYADKTFSNVSYFCFYVDMTHWTTEARKGLANGSEVTSLMPFIQISHIGDDGMRYSATSALEAGKNFELLQNDGSWKVIKTDDDTEHKTKDVKIPSTGETVTAPIKNASLPIPTDYKGYVRFKIADTYDTTYYDATIPGWGIANQPSFQMNGLEVHTGFWPANVGVGGDDNRQEPGYILFGDIGFMGTDANAPATPVVEEKPTTPTTDDSKVEESTSEDSQLEESTAEESKVEISKVESSVVEDVATETESKKSHAWIWILVVVIVLIGGGVAAYFIVKKNKNSKLEDEDTADLTDDNEETEQLFDSNDNDDNSDDESDKD